MFAVRNKISDLMAKSGILQIIEALINSVEDGIRSLF